MKEPMEPSSRSRLWEIGWLPVALAVGVFALLYVGMPWRGMNVWGVWLGEASDAVSAWLVGPGESRWSAEVLQQAWGGHAALPPLTVGLVSACRAWLGLSLAEASHAVGALAVALTVLPVWGFGRRSGGVPAAVTAVLAFALLPRTMGHGTVAGFSAVAGCAWTWGAYALYRARSSRRWTWSAALALGLAPLASPAALALWVPWLALTLWGGEQAPAGAGRLAVRSFPARLVLLPAAGLALAVGLYPWLWASPRERVWAYLTHFMVQPKEPFLYLGALIQAQRLPWHGGPVLLLTTLPPTLAVLGSFGIFGEIVLRPLSRSPLGQRIRPWLHLRPDPEAAGFEAQEAKRWAFGVLATALVLPWLCGGPVFGVVDLLALATPLFAVFVGCTLSRLFSATSAVVQPRLDAAAGQGRVGRAALVAALAGLGTLVFAPAAMDAVRAQPTAEAYRAWVVGGPEGALSKGFGRAPHAPVPVVVARHLEGLAGGEGGRTMAVLADDASWRRVLERYRRDGVVKRLPAWSEPFRAEVLILPHADADPRYYEAAGDFAQAVPPGRSVVLRSGAVRLVSVGQPVPSAGGLP